MVTDGFMAAGDEAHQADPLHGGGISASMDGGRFAGEVAAQAIRAGDVSEQFLRKYEEKWESKYGKVYRRLKRIRQAALKIPEEKLSSMIKMASQVETKDMTLMELIKIVLKSHPRLLLEVVPFFLGQ
jgi:digeranylgeranylglycerophospholipid reductase